MNGFESKLEQAINEVFGAEPFNAVDEQLFKWLIYSLIGNGRHIGTLDALNYSLFKEKLVVLIDAVYEWHIEEAAAKERGS